jgi:hypothetical protein
MEEPVTEMKRLCWKLADVVDNLEAHLSHGSSAILFDADLDSGVELLQALRRLNDQPRLGSTGIARK